MGNCVSSDARGSSTTSLSPAPPGPAAGKTASPPLTDLVGDWCRQFGTDEFCAAVKSSSLARDVAAIAARVTRALAAVRGDHARIVCGESGVVTGEGAKHFLEVEGIEGIGDCCCGKITRIAIRKDDGAVVFKWELPRTNERSLTVVSASNFGDIVVVQTRLARNTVSRSDQWSSGAVLTVERGVVTWFGAPHDIDRNFCSDYSRQVSDGYNWVAGVGEGTPKICRALQGAEVDMRYQDGLLHGSPAVSGPLLTVHAHRGRVGRHDGPAVVVAARAGLCPAGPGEHSPPARGAGTFGVVAYGRSGFPHRPPNEGPAVVITDEHGHLVEEAYFVHGHLVCPEKSVAVAAQSPATPLVQEFLDMKIFSREPRRLRARTPAQLAESMLDGEQEGEDGICRLALLVAGRCRAGDSALFGGAPALPPPPYSEKSPEAPEPASGAAPAPASGAAPL